MTTTPIDRAGNVAFSATFEYFNALRLIAIVCFCLLLTSLVVNLVQFRRPPAVVVLRVDDAGRAEPIRYRENSYTPREAEVVSGLHNWVIDRFRLIKSVIPENFHENYYFLDSHLSRELTATDASIVAQVQAGTLPEQNATVNTIRFRAFDTEKQPDGTVGSGECVIDLYKTYNVTGPLARERWLITIKYRLNPTAAAERGRMDPNFQIANPLGLTITWFHEDRALN